MDFQNQIDYSQINKKQTKKGILGFIIYNIIFYIVVALIAFISLMFSIKFIKDWKLLVLTLMLGLSCILNFVNLILGIIRFNRTCGVSTVILVIITVINILNLIIYPVFTFFSFVFFCGAMGI